MNGACIILDVFRRHEVDTIFSYIGGSVLPIFDELQRSAPDIRLVRLLHEQAVTHAADGYARATGKTGVVLVTSGPGATNTVTGIATAYMDSVPLVVITGQVPTFKIGTDAFQETDIIGITLPITKLNLQVRKPEDLEKSLHRAFTLARSGRPGPVLVDIPLDIQSAEVCFRPVQSAPAESRWTELEPDIATWKQALAMLTDSHRPLVLSGGGVTTAGAEEKVNAFLDRSGIPAVTTLMGQGIRPQREGLLIGPIGMHGTLAGNFALQRADLVLALGTRFSDRILGHTGSFASRARIIHVDIDPAELGKNRRVDLAVSGRIDRVMDWLLREWPSGCDFSHWREELQAFRDAHPGKPVESGFLKARTVLEAASRLFPEDTIVVADVGQNQMWVSQCVRLSRPRSFLTSGGMGTMGYALPAAIGARLGQPGRPVLVIAGDGGLQMNIQELATVSARGLDLKILLLDNGMLGMVRQWQQLLFQGRYVQVEMEGNPDFCRVARAFGIPAFRLSNRRKVEEAMRHFAAAPGSMLLHARIDPLENVLPMVPPGKPLDQMITEMEGGTK